MCGIVGIAGVEFSDANALAAKVRQMGLWQIHRGPDDWGEWIQPGIGLGHNRLAILDLDCGRQPMGSADGTVQVVFNGEIYNHAALRAELIGKGRPFRTSHSDTEVIVQGYLEWGADVFERLLGMFAIGIWDGGKRTLTLARDRSGIKPLYYSCLQNRTLVFASEPKALFASKLLSAEVRTEGLPEYFVHRTSGDSTLFSGMEKVPAATFQIFDFERGMQAPRSFWSPLSNYEEEESAAAEVEESLAESVKTHLQSDVPLGILLSGGVDSSLIAALLRRQERPTALTVGSYSALDEVPHARVVARHLQMDLLEQYVEAPAYLGCFSLFSYFNDDPVADPSALALMLLCQKARDFGIKVLLSGEGADELFGGYNSYVRYNAFQQLAKLPGASLWGPPLQFTVGPRNADYCRSLPGVFFHGTAHLSSLSQLKLCLIPDLAKPIALAEHRARLYAASLPRHLPAIRKAMLFDQQFRLPNDVLARTDRASMAASVEVRVPYLHAPVIELANRLPDRDCVRLMPPYTKMLLKKLAAKGVPRQVIYRTKRGFDLPLNGWLKNDFRPMVQEYLGNRAIPGVEYGSLSTLYQKHTRGDANLAPLLWAWLVLERWYRLWVRKEAQVQIPTSGINRKAYREVIES